MQVVTQELTEVYNEINVVFMFCSPWIKGISTFKSDYLRNKFHKPIAATDSDFHDGLGQSKLKSFLKGFLNGTF